MMKNCMNLKGGDNNSLPLILIVIVLLSVEQFFGFVVTTAVQAYSVFCSSSTTFDITSALLLLMFSLSLLVHFIVIPSNEERITHCIVVLYPNERLV